MKEVTELKLTKKKLSAPVVFLLVLAALIYSPFAGITSMNGMVGDTAIQIKLGLDGLASGHFITDEIYSWHPDLVFTAHESGWYLLLGLAYKLLNIWGVILVGCIFTYGAVFTAVLHLKDRVHPLITALVLVITPFLGGFPDYNVRPAVTSCFALTLLIVTMIGERKATFKASLFAVLCFVLAWLHGGILPLFFAVYVMFIVVSLIYRDFNSAKVLILGALIGFSLSLLNPINIRIWTFGLRQSTATDLWAQVDEWNPMHFSVVQIVLILLVLIGFMVSDKVRLFDRKTITKLCLLCMFFIATCVYKRFVAYFSLTYILFAPEAYEALFPWIVKNLFKIEKKISLSESFYYLLAVVCGLMTIAVGVINVGNYLPTGTYADIEKMAAYDVDAIEFIKSQGYEKVFNSFNTGAWLTFYDVDVHIDNRIDPYMREFSSEDHIRGQMNVASLADLDAFRARYDNDAFLIDMSDGYSYLLYEIETYAADRYQVVYDNVVESSINGISNMRFVVVECQ
ncbi:MAG: hypothetical protein MJ094_00785 [Saccharofermentans sp.]|nr:hypothetical protein [Saccharofermentans sp.]